MKNSATSPLLFHSKNLTFVYNPGIIKLGLKKKSSSSSKPPFRPKVGGRADVQDAAGRREVAVQLVEMAFSWGQKGSLCRELQSLPTAAAKEALKELTIDRVARFDRELIRISLNFSRETGDWWLECAKTPR